MRKIILSTLFVGAMVISACGTMTGLPGHGGGKRFMIEQELVSATVKAVAKDMDISELKGHRVSLSIVALDDEGSGNIVSGRFSPEAVLRGGYISSAPTKSKYPILPSVSTTTTDAISTVTTTSVPLNAPYKEQQEGADQNYSIGASFNGGGSYATNPLFPSDADLIYLSSIIRNVLKMKGVVLVPPSDADTELFISVDVFGTNRNRNDWYVLNQENLSAKTSIEFYAYDLISNSILLPPRTVSFEAKYTEQYVLWAGPFKTRKTVAPSEVPLISLEDTKTSNTHDENGIEKPYLKKIKNSKQENDKK